MDNRLRPEEGGRGGTCNEGVDHVCVTWFARLVYRAGRGIGREKGVQVAASIDRAKY